MRVWMVAGGIALGVAAAPCAWALTQPNGTIIPSPPGCDANHPTGLLAALSCVCTAPGVCNIGAPCSGGGACDDGQHGTCETTMAHAANDNTCIPSLHTGLDPATEASTTPETFQPTCALTFTVVTRGQAQFKNVFGWYNVTGSAPPLSDLHTMLGCGAAAGSTAVLDIKKEPSYKGGAVGFFLMTPEAHDGGKQCAGGDCCPTAARVAAGAGYVYYSERKWNPDQAGASSFIHLLVMNSHLVKRKFYFAWEDIFGGSDNEFTDLVTSVEGVECSGGGEACDTGQKGACALGVTSCSGGALGCTPVHAPGAEACNGVDDDCDGVVDDGATCPSPSDICRDGACIHRCGTAEFPCAPGTACDVKSGYCVPSACVGVSCPADRVCRDGACVAPCEGVHCPHGQTCVNDACVDLCNGVDCGAGQVCRSGTCLPGCGQCSGIVCGASLVCDGASGDCRDPSCPASCPAGTYCKSGACVDSCTGVTCPVGQSCLAGHCQSASGSGGATDGGLMPIPDGGASAPFDAGSGLPGAPSSPNGDVADRAGTPSCACDLAAPSSPSSLAAWLAALVAGATFVTRRRARRS